MIEIGESSENLVYILESATEYYEQKIKLFGRQNTAISTTILIILISVFVAFMVFSNSNTHIRSVKRNKYRIKNINFNSIVDI